jgi:hypothetical protein
MNHMRRWGAVWILVVLFVVSWWFQFVAMVAEPGPFEWTMFWSATFENWQSEFLQLAVQAVLIASLVGQKKFFNADGGADKEDVDRILRAIGSLTGDEQKHRA